MSTTGSCVLNTTSSIQISFHLAVSIFNIFVQYREYFGGLSAAGQASVNYTVLVDGNLADGTMIVESATVTGNEADSTSGNDNDSVTLTVATPIFTDGFESGDTTAWSAAP